MMTSPSNQSISLTELSNVIEYGFPSTGYLILCTALTFLMTPGVGFFYSGMIRSKNAISLLMLSFLTMAVVTLQWFAIGFSLSYSETGSPFIGNWSMGGLTNVGHRAMEFTAQVVPASAFCVYQLQFAAVTPSIIFGSVAERMRLIPAIVFIFAWTTLVYDPIAYWTWATAGFSGLAYSLIIGKRKFPEQGKPHNMTNIFLGTALMWFGWFGFNGGSALAPTGRAAMAILVTTLCASSSAITWVVFDYFVSSNRKISGLSFCCGVVSGLVIATPMSGYIEPWAAVFSGVIGGLIVNMTGRLKIFIGYDDTLDAFPIHGVAGIVGTLFCGVFARKSIALADLEIIPGGVLDGNWQLLKYQFIAVLAESVYSFVVSYMILYLINMAPRLHLRSSEEEEKMGVDLAEMGEVGYDLMDVHTFYNLLLEEGTLPRPETEPLLRGDGDAIPGPEEEEASSHSGSTLSHKHLNGSSRPPLAPKTVIEKGTFLVEEQQQRDHRLSSDVRSRPCSYSSDKLLSRKPSSSHSSSLIRQLSIQSHTPMLRQRGTVTRRFSFDPPRKMGSVSKMSSDHGYEPRFTMVYSKTDPQFRRGINLKDGSERYSKVDPEETVQTHMSTVYLAYDSQCSDLVVVKSILNLEFANREIDMLQKIINLDIPYCIRMRDLIELSPSKRLIVFPYHDKFDIHELSLQRISALFKQLLTALAVLHRNQIAHLDVTPSNIMLEKSSQDLVLIDFGFSRYFTSEDQDPFPQNGTAGYVSPELLYGEARNGAPDIFAAGVLLGQCLENYVHYLSLEILGGRLVGPEKIEVIWRSLLDALYNESDYWLPIVTEGVKLLTRMLDPNPQTRITAAEALKHPFLNAQDADFEGTDLLSYQQNYPRKVMSVFKSRKNRIIVHYR